MKRSFDFLLALAASLLLLPLILISVILVKLSSKGPAIYWSDRVGKRNVLFKMAKLRTMKVNTPVVATHLLSDPQSQLTPIGGFLRKSSLDELPQLWNILCGDMSFVGPRPALFNQADLIALRTECGVDGLLPGLTGWAQLNGRDELSKSLVSALSDFGNKLDKNISSFNELQDKKFNELKDRQTEMLTNTEKQLDKMRDTVDEKLTKT
jgi:O-antigen biosynthesis protein WbqP